MAWEIRHVLILSLFVLGAACQGNGANPDQRNIQFVDVGQAMSPHDSAVVVMDAEVRDSGESPMPDAGIAVRDAATAKGDFGDICGHRSDCESGICLRAAYSQETAWRCSRRCMRQSDCLSNWSCRARRRTANQCIFGVTSNEMAMLSSLQISPVGSYVAGQLVATDLAARQLMESFRREMISVSNVDEALNYTDDGLDLFTIVHTASGNRFTHLKFYLGDTEVGYLFLEGGIKLRAFISDGDVRDCQAFEAVDDFLGVGGMSEEYCFPT